MKGFEELPAKLREIADAIESGNLTDDPEDWRSAGYDLIIIAEDIEVAEAEEGGDE